MKTGIVNFLFCRRVINAMLVVAAMLSFAVIAQAQASQVFVSVHGFDNGTCSEPSPCRRLNVAVGVVNPGGVVVVLDSGDYDRVNINKSVSIHVAPGVYAGIMVDNDDGPAISVTVGATDSVTLRGLTLYARGGQAGQVGIRFNTGGALHVENCVINGFSLSGISSGGPEMFVKDTTIRNSGYSILIASSTVTRAVIENCRIENGFHGVHASSNSRVTAKNTTVAGNTSTGFLASVAVNGGGSAEMNLENCVSSHNGTGIFANVNTTVRVSNSTVTGNANGLSHMGTLLSRYNNTVEGNTFNGTFSGLFAAK